MTRMPAGSLLPRDRHRLHTHTHARTSSACTRRQERAERLRHAGQSQDSTGAAEGTTAKQCWAIHEERSLSADAKNVHAPHTFSLIHARTHAHAAKVVNFLAPEKPRLASQAHRHTNAHHKRHTDTQHTTHNTQYTRDIRHGHNKHRHTAAHRHTDTRTDKHTDSYAHTCCFPSRQCSWLG